MKKTRTAKKLELSTQAIRLLRPTGFDEVAGGEQCDGGTSGLSSISRLPKKPPI